VPGPGGFRERAVKVGVFGGSFDPVHIGHLVVAEHAAERLGLEQVRFVPAGQQPLKIGHHAAAADRLAMVEAGIRDNPRFVVDPREASRPGPSYTVETLRALAAEAPGDALFFLVGADAARDIPAWRDPQGIAALAAIVVLTRPGASPPAHPLVARVVEVPGVDVSATQIREAVRCGRSIRYLVPRAVEDYIVRHGLYRD
jgi:nicotinate-nucleotide adenylyltransferase